MNRIMRSLRRKLGKDIGGHLHRQSTDLLKLFYLKVAGGKEQKFAGYGG
jgi:hypothetical protein